MAPSNYREVGIEDLQDSDALAAWGFAVLKVTKGPEVLGVKVRITSVPQDVIDDLRKKSPRPPSKMVMGDPSNDEHKALGITTRRAVYVPDYNDPEYVAALDEYNRTFSKEVVGRGVEAKLNLKDGSAAQTPEQKYRALEERGLTGTHFAEITNQIMALVQWTEDERTNFLTKPSVSKAGS